MLTHKIENLQGLYKKLAQLKEKPERGEVWAKQSAMEFEAKLRSNLAEQKNSLSSVTIRLYKLRGSPNGSGIRNHIHNEVESIPGGIRSVVGISQGKPTMVAKVQEYGTTIAVTDKMRGWFGRHGIHLRSSTIFIRIPGRRFWSGAWKAVSRQSRKDLKRIL